MDATTTTPLPPFLRLPAEIRVQIYDLLDFTQPRPISIHDASIYPPPLGRTCRLLREETMDCFFRRNRFMLSNCMGLSDTLRRITPENVGRISHLRLKYLGGAIKSDRYHDVLPVVQHLDIDILRETPWFAVSEVTTEAAGSAYPFPELKNPALPSYCTRYSAHLPAETLDYLDGLPELDVKLLLIPMLLRKVLQAIVRAHHGSAIMLDRHMLEFTMQHWLWISHTMRCTDFWPAECKDCVRALHWLST